LRLPASPITRSPTMPDPPSGRISTSHTNAPAMPPPRSQHVQQAIGCARGVVTQAALPETLRETLTATLLVASRPSSPWTRQRDPTHLSATGPPSRSLVEHRRLRDGSRDRGCAPAARPTRRRAGTAPRAPPRRHRRRIHMARPTLRPVAHRVLDPAPTPPRPLDPSPPDELSPAT
jgi:hypothetical protein